MERGRAILLGLCVAVTGFALAFALPALSPTRVLWYYPLEHRWAFEVRPSGLAMDWYGRTLLASGVSTALYLAGFLVGRRRKVEDRTLHLWIAWAMTALLFCAALYVFRLAPRRPTPEPLPPGYVPR